MKYFKGLFLNTMREFMQLKSKILLLIVNSKLFIQSCIFLITVT